MSKIAILTDSSCDIPQELAEKYGIDIMGFHILLDDEDIVEREKYTPEEFYDKMRAAKGIPSTAAITPIQFCEKYCQYVDEGYTDVIHVPINRSGSSTYNNAVMAQGMLREERPEHHLNIHLLDPHTYSMVFGWYLCEMARKLKNGETQMNKMEVILGPYSLKQMKKSGRISAAAAVMGELMGIRPIITLIDGKTRVESKVRGDDKVIPAMIDLCKKRTEGVEDFDYMIGHTSIPQAAELEKACRSLRQGSARHLQSGRRRFGQYRPRHPCAGLCGQAPGLSISRKDCCCAAVFFRIAVAFRPKLWYNSSRCACGYGSLKSNLGF